MPRKTDQAPSRPRAPRNDGYIPVAGRDPAAMVEVGRNQRRVDAECVRLGTGFAFSRS
jgi:hypothetical protein